MKNILSFENKKKDINISASQLTNAIRTSKNELSDSSYNYMNPPIPKEKPIKKEGGFVSAWQEGQLPD